MGETVGQQWVPLDFSSQTSYKICKSILRNSKALRMSKKTQFEQIQKKITQNCLNCGRNPKIFLILTGHQNRQSENFFAKKNNCKRGENVLASLLLKTQTETANS